MALQKNITINYRGDIEVNIENAYIKVDRVDCNKSSMSIHKHIKRSQNEPALFAEIISCDYNLNGENPIKQAYLYLKTLPEFVDAIDC
jgi:hypothetical protein